MTLADNFNGMLEYGNVGMMGEAEYRLWEGHASACLGRADARPSQERLFPIFQYSNIPSFLFKFPVRLFWGSDSGLTYCAKPRVRQ
jgi:hypothetical protein